MSRLFMIPVLLGVTIGVPFLLDRLSGPNTTGAQVAAPPPAASETPAPKPAPATDAGLTLPSQGSGALISANTAPLDGTRFQSADQVLRFDVTKEWVYHHWPRKSTSPTDVGLFAVRVPLVTGTHLSAIAGSLTYYFNLHGQVEHISFRGRTGDTSHLVNFLVRTYGFQRSAAPVGEQLFQVKRGDRVQSELRTSAESVLRNTSPHSSFTVELELARPGSQRCLPPRVPQFEIPQVATASPPASTTGGDTSATEEKSDDAGALPPYLDKFRYATPDEEGQVLWKRWPN